jgi:hypothetical protein
VPTIGDDKDARGDGLGARLDKRLALLEGDGAGNLL